MAGSSRIAVVRYGPHSGLLINDTGGYGGIVVWTSAAKRRPNPSSRRTGPFWTYSPPRSIPPLRPRTRHLGPQPCCFALLVISSTRSAFNQSLIALQASSQPWSSIMSCPIPATSRTSAS